MGRMERMGRMGDGEGQDIPVQSEWGQDGPGLDLVGLSRCGRAHSDVVADATTETTRQWLGLGWDWGCH
jgi:hypothetical protein